MVSGLLAAEVDEVGAALAREGFRLEGEHGARDGGEDWAALLTRR